MINDLFWLTIQDFFEYAYRGWPTIKECKKKCQSRCEAHCNSTAQMNSKAENILDSDLSKWMGEAASLAVAPKDKMNLKVDSSNDMLKI